MATDRTQKPNATQDWVGGSGSVQSIFLDTVRTAIANLVDMVLPTITQLDAAFIITRDSLDALKDTKTHAKPSHKWYELLDSLENAAATVPSEPRSEDSAVLPDHLYLRALSAVIENTLVLAAGFLATASELEDLVDDGAAAQRIHQTEALTVLEACAAARNQSRQLLSIAHDTRWMELISDSASITVSPEDETANAALEIGVSAVAHLGKRRGQAYGSKDAAFALSEGIDRRPGRGRHPSVTIIIPARNEEENVASVLATLPPVHEIILVDGYSKDDTISVARQAMPDIRVVEQTRRGKGNALACGFAAATGDILVMFDADGSANPADIPIFVDTLVRGADFVKGSRFTVGGGSADIRWLHRLGAAAILATANRLLQAQFSDFTYGYGAFWRDLVPVLNLPAYDYKLSSDESMVWGDGFEIHSLINCRLAVWGAEIVEVPSFERPRLRDRSHRHAFKNGRRILETLLTEYRRARKTALVAPIEPEFLEPAATLVKAAPDTAAPNTEYVEYVDLFRAVAP